MLFKYRSASAPKDKGNYDPTLLLGASSPTGSLPNGAGHVIITPTLGLGKGYGPVDLQTTFSGVSIPTSESASTGHPLVWNATLQYQAGKRVWPEIGMNATFWPDGTLSGKNRVFLIPGLVLGRSPIHNRVGFTLGGGLQIAASSSTNTTPAGSSRQGSLLIRLSEGVGRHSATPAPPPRAYTVPFHMPLSL